MNGLVIDERADGGSPVHTLEAMGTGLQWVPASWGSAWLHLSGGGGPSSLHVCSRGTSIHSGSPNPQTRSPGVHGECQTAGWSPSTELHAEWRVNPQPQQPGTGATRRLRAALKGVGTLPKKAVSCPTTPTPTPSLTPSPLCRRTLPEAGRSGRQQLTQQFLELI